MPKSIELLLTENVDNLGIVGDVVKVRTGYARNYLLPMNLATEPNEEMIKSLAGKRADAERHQRELRAAREQMIQKIEGLEVALVRPCNDLGQLYGSVTQQDIADELAKLGYHLKAREIRLAQTIKRIDSYHVPVKVAADLEAEITLVVKPDREIKADEREELEFDNEGNVIEKRPERHSRRQRDAAPADEKPAKADPGAKGDARKAR